MRLALRGVELVLTTDAGVFSRGRVDPGTRLLIEAMRLPEAGPILDLGCGYGPIGLTAAKLRPDLEVHLVDVNERAVALARRNAAANGIRNVRIVQGDGFAPFPPEMRFAAIYTNPPYRAGKAAVYAMAQQAHERLLPGAFFACVGRTKQGVKSLARHLETLFAEVREVEKGGGYRVLEAIKGEGV